MIETQNNFSLFRAYCRNQPSRVTTFRKNEVVIISLIFCLNMPIVCRATFESFIFSFQFNIDNISTFHQHTEIDEGSCFDDTLFLWITKTHMHLSLGLTNHATSHDINEWIFLFQCNQECLSSGSDFQKVMYDYKNRNCWYLTPQTVKVVLVFFGSPVAGSWKQDVCCENGCDNTECIFCTDCYRPT